MRCPGCASLDDKVVDSRTTDAGTAIRRRRECLTCGRRFTTFERLEELPLLAVKRSGERVPFDRSKVVAGVLSATKGRPVSDQDVQDLAGDVEDQLRSGGPEVPSTEVGLAVLERLRTLDGVAYVRFASVYKGFDDPADFTREIGLLKQGDPKPH
jgi:transcriptional repressor NrdR